MSCNLPPREKGFALWAKREAQREEKVAASAAHVEIVLSRGTVVSHVKSKQYSEHSIYLNSLFWSE
jgi:hypothetical protein